MGRMLGRQTWNLRTDLENSRQGQFVESFSRTIKNTSSILAIPLARKLQSYAHYMLQGG